jgi:hypothetical protein
MIAEQVAGGADRVGDRQILVEVVLDAAVAISSRAVFESLFSP